MSGLPQLLHITLMLLAVNYYEVNTQSEEIATELIPDEIFSMSPELPSILPEIPMSPDSSSILPDIAISPVMPSSDSSLFTEFTTSESPIDDISTDPSDYVLMTSSSSSDITEFSDLPPQPQPGVANNNNTQTDSPNSKNKWLKTAIIIAIIVLIVIAVIIAILVCIICKLRKKSSDETLDDNQTKLGDIEAQQAMEPEELKPIGEEAIKQDEETIRSANVEPVVTTESQQTDESKQLPKEDTPIVTPKQDSEQTPKDQTKQIPSKKTPKTTSPEDTSVMYVIDGRKRRIKS